MTMVPENFSRINLPWLNLEGISENRNEPISFSSSNIIQHSPHPSRVRHIKGLKGTQICVVDTDEFSSKRRPSVLFPPNQYADNKLKMAAKNFNLPWHKETLNFVTARPKLDTILAMNYFTGLRNMSFRNQEHANINPISNTSGWETKLHELTTEALAPVLDKFKNIEMVDYPQRPSTSSSMKRLYSSSGRLLTSRPENRPRTCYSKRPFTTTRVSQNIADFNITPELDTQVFCILGGILQIFDPEIVKTWILTATDREKNLVISILRSALIDKEELNMFVAEASKEQQNQIVYTPNKRFSSKLNTIPEGGGERICDVLLVNGDNNNEEKSTIARPPTSSTFRTTKEHATRPNTRCADEWIPSESLVIK